ncbi:MAG: phosphoribulokinase [Pseudomonadota bacterium]
MRDAAQAIREAVESPAIARVIEEEKLPESYRGALREHIAPVATAILRALDAASRPLLIGINGCQGSGKSTLARFLAVLLEQAGGLRCPEVSIDDLYLPRADRIALGQQVHPLLATRGVPGTHDLPLGRTVLERLLSPSRAEDVAIPRFLKSIDDRAPADQWSRWQGATDAVLFEGWCVACTPQEASALDEPINALEAEEDRDGEWRRYVNRSLREDYPALFGPIDFLVFLRAPSFECVHQWRRKQEEKLTQRLRDENAPPEAFSRVMSNAELTRFIQHYERLTRHMLSDLGERAQAIIDLAEDHRLVGHQLRGNPGSSGATHA